MLKNKNLNSSTETNNLINKEIVSVQTMDSDNATNSNGNFLLNNNIIQISQIGLANYADVNVKSSKC